MREITSIRMAESASLLPARRVSATIPAWLWRGLRRRCVRYRSSNTVYSPASPAHDGAPE